jgi:uncharacterized protein RhaS with RHS repeats
MIHSDHLSTPQKMTDACGTVVWSADYKPLGETNITKDLHDLLALRRWELLHLAEPQLMLYDVVEMS